MQHEVTTIPHGSPLVGIVMAGGGAMGYCYTTLLKWAAASSPVLAQAAVPGTSMSWENVGQTVTAITTIVGGVITWLSLQRSAVHKSQREDRVEDALADIKIDLAKRMADIDLRHAEQIKRLDRQDDALAEIKQAIQPPNPSLCIAEPDQATLVRPSPTPPPAGPS